MNILLHPSRPAPAFLAALFLGFDPLIVPLRQSICENSHLFPAFAPSLVTAAKEHSDPELRNPGRLVSGSEGLTQNTRGAYSPVLL